MNICCLHTRDGEEYLVDMLIINVRFSVNSDLVRWYLECPECNHRMVAIIAIANDWKPGAEPEII